MNKFNQESEGALHWKYKGETSPHYKHCWKDGKIPHIHRLGESILLKHPLLPKVIF